MPAGTLYGSSGVFNMNTASGFNISGGLSDSAAYNLGKGQGNSIGGIMGGAGSILGGVGGLMNAFVGYKNYKLAKKEFAFTKAMANRNLANQAKMINNEYDVQAKGAADMMGEGGFVNPQIQQQYADAAKKKYVDGSAI